MNDDKIEPGKLFAELFPNGTTLTKVGKHQATHPVHLREALAGDDPVILRETLIGVLWEYAIHYDRLNRFNEHIFEQQEEIARLREATRWIPVSERLPDWGCMVETFGAYDTIAICWYRGRWVNCYDTTLDMSWVTHWRHIIDRQGPKEGGENA